MHTPTHHALPATPIRALSVKEFCRITSIGRTRFYVELREGRLHPIKVGRRTLIPMNEVDRWLQALTCASTEVGKQ